MESFMCASVNRFAQIALYNEKQRLTQGKNISREKYPQPRYFSL